MAISLHLFLSSLKNNSQKSTRTSQATSSVVLIRLDQNHKMVSVEFFKIVIDEIPRDSVNDAQLYDKYVLDYDNRDFKAELTEIMG
jgi:hypothetical protein